MSVGAGTTNAGTCRTRTQASQAARTISTSTMLGMAEPSAWRIFPGNRGTSGTCGCVLAFMVLPAVMMRSPGRGPS